MIRRRCEALSDFLKNDEAIIIKSAPNRRYLTAFASSAGTVLVTKKAIYFIIDFRYFEKAKEVINFANVILQDRLFKQINEILKNDKVKTVFVETSSLSLKEYDLLVENLSDFEVSKSSVAEEFLLSLRAAKTADEIALIKEAQAITDECFEYILSQIHPGKTERAIALDIEFFMRKHGSDGVAFDIIAVSGNNSSLPHGTPTDRVLQKGDFVTLDFGARVCGYCADMTRTVAIGQVSEKQRTVYDTVLRAQLEAMKYIKPGAVCKDIDKVARDIIDNAGFKGCFGHSLGHSLGVEIHESPNFSISDETKLKSGMVLSVEPGVYLENEFGVRIEDIITVTDTGYFNFTKSPKELIIL